jgi:hypothetical protein
MLLKQKQQGNAPHAKRPKVTTTAPVPVAPSTASAKAKPAKKHTKCRQRVLEMLTENR